MDAETRKTLESNAAQLEREATTLLRHAYETNDYETRKARQEGAANAREDAAAIRAALAEVDRLTQQVATLNRDRSLMHADRIIDAATIADLEARAIPKNACLYLANGMTIEEDEGEFLLWRNDDQRVTEPLPTLAAALSAAKESP